jgi:aspartate racemase
MGQRTIGIMGGLGPAATLSFMQRIIELTADAPIRMLVDCDPTLPDVSRSILGRGPSCGPALVAMAQGLERAGAEIIVLACNAAHYYEAEIRRALGVPFLSMIEVACRTISETRTGVARVGILGAESCIVAGVYQNALADRHIEPLVLGRTDFAPFNAGLDAIRAGDLSASRKSDMLHAIRRLSEAGAQMVILACTEVPLVVGQADTPVPLLDPGITLADAVVRSTPRMLN